MEGAWRCIAYGKHPAAKDFFRLGRFGLLETDFARWVDKGYRLLHETKEPLSPNSWRFWTRGPQRGTLACGVLRDCQDQLGRPYPFLILGVGILKGWEDPWDRIFIACERSWVQMEYLYTRRFTDVKQMEEEIGRILPPIPPNPEARGEKDRSKNLPVMEPQHASESTEKWIFRFFQTGEIFLPLDPRSPDPLEGVHGLHQAFGKMTPQSLFIGGTAEKAYLALFNRPLVPTDFVHLWSVASEGGQGGGAS